MGLYDQVTCYSGTSARAVNHSDCSVKSMEPEKERLMQGGEWLWKGCPASSSSLGPTALKAVLEFALVKIYST